MATVVATVRQPGSAIWTAALGAREKNCRGARSNGLQIRMGSKRPTPISVNFEFHIYVHMYVSNTELRRGGLGALGPL